MDFLEQTIKYSSKLKVLYVEDNKEARESTISVFEEFFDNIVISTDGKDGLGKFIEHKDSIKIIITDINMPRLNGLQMIEKIREIDKEVPILVLSAYNESGFFIDSIKLGVEGYLLKPIEIDQFLSVLNKIVEIVQLREESSINLNLLYQYQEATDNSSIVSKSDLEGIITYVNDEFCRISEYSKEELIGQPSSIVRHPDNSPKIYKELWDTVKEEKKTWQGILRNISKNKKINYLKTTIKPILDKDGNILEYIALRDDVTDIMNPRKQLNDLMQSFDEAMVVFVKIEEFTDIEKYYGQRLANKIEKKFAKDIMDYMPLECILNKVFVLGNGEYAFAKDRKNCNIKIENTISNLKELQQRINNTSVNVGEVDYDISVIISCAYGENAMENAKSGLKELIDTKQDFIIANNFTQIEYNIAEQNLQTIKMVKKAIEDEKIISFFQPIINNTTKKIEKYESLVRLIDEYGAIISPYSFLDVAKKGKYYPKITSMVLENSFDALKYTQGEISINLSVLDIEKKSTRTKLYNLLENSKENASRIVFELLEDEEVKDFNLVKTFINSVKKMGVKIAIDDFGAGYSNFERLLDYQPDILKIDGSLIKNIENSKFSISVVKTIVAFSKEQNIKTVAEYVENENIYNILHSLGVDYSQGYFFGKPELINKN